MTRIRTLIAAAVLAAGLLSCDMGLQDELDKLKGENTGLKEALEQKTATITELQAEKDTAEGKADELNDSISTLTAQIEAVTLQIETIEGECDAARAERDAKVTELAAKVEELGLANTTITTLNSEKETQAAALANAQKALADAEADNEATAAEIASLTQAKTTAETALDATTAKLIEALVTASLSPAASNDEMVQALVAEVIRLSGEVASLTTQVGTLQGNLTAANTAKTNLQNLLYGEGGTEESPIAGSVQEKWKTAEAARTELQTQLATANSDKTNLHNALYGEGGTAESPIAGSVQEKWKTAEAARTELQTQLATANSDKTNLHNALYGEGGTAESPIAGSVQAQLNAANTAKTALQSTLYGAGGTEQSPKPGSVQKQLNDAIGERDDARASLASLHNALYGEGGTEQDPKPGSVQKQLNAANDAITLKNRQIELMSAGGKLHDAAWFAEFDAIVANAQSIGSELTTVFLGDGLILDAVGGKTEAEIKAEMSHIPTARVHVAAIEGATVEEIKYGIENGWLPEKTAYTVIHAGRAEVEEHASVLSSSYPTRSKEIGQKIGSIYTALIAKTTDGGKPATSVIFSGIIPPDASTIHPDNISAINGNDGIKSIVPPSTITSIFLTFIDADDLKFQTDGVFEYNAIITNVASANRANQQGAQGCQAPFFWIKIYRMVSAT